MSFCRYTIQGEYSCKSRKHTKWNKSKVTENFTADQIPDGKYYVSGPMNDTDKEGGPAMYGMPSSAVVSKEGRILKFTEQWYTYEFDQGTKRYEDSGYNLKLKETQTLGDGSIRYRLEDSDGAVAYLTKKNKGQDILAMNKKPKAFKKKWGEHACGICLQPHMGNGKGSLRDLTMKYYKAKYWNDTYDETKAKKLAGRIKKKAEKACLSTCGSGGIQKLLDNYGIDAKRSKQN